MYRDDGGGAHLHKQYDDDKLLCALHCMYAVVGRQLTET